ncbi:MAG: CHAT domain-containing protein [Cyanophyceae cyanobacterium]
MKRRLIFVAIVGLLLSLSLHALIPVRAEQPINRQAGAALVQRAQQYYARGEFSASAEALQQAASAYAAVGEPLKQAQILSLLSLAQQQQGQWQQAQDALDESLALLERQTPSVAVPVRAQVLNNQGRLQIAIGQAEAALASWQEAEAFYRQAGDRLGMTGSQINQAQALETLGFYRRSCDRVLQAIDRQQKCEELTPQTLTEVLTALQQQPRSLQANSLRSLGNVLRLMGRLEESQAVLKHSLTLARQEQTPQAYSRALLSLGNTQQALATRAQDLNDVEAQHYAQAALALYRAASDTAATAPSLTVLHARLNELNLLVKNHRWSEAEELVLPLQTALQSLPPSRATVYAQISFAQNLASLQAHAEVASWSEIAQLLLKAHQDAVSLEDRRAQSYALGSLGQLQVDYQTSLTSAPQELLQQALSLAYAENAPEISYRWQWYLGRLYADKAREQAIAAYEAAFTNLQQLRSDLVTLNQEIQFSFREQVEPIYRELAGLLLQPPSGEANQSALKEARQVVEALQIAELDNYFQDACATLQEEDIEQVDNQAAVVYTIILPERLEVILSTPDGILYHHTNWLSQAEVESTVFQLGRYLKEPDRLRDVQRLSHQLYSWLLTPFEAELRANSVKTLVFVLDSLLQNVPMAVLYDGEEYLVQKYATAITPGLRLLGPERLSQQTTTLIAGVSERLQISGQEFTALPNVETEWLAIQSVVPSESLLNARLTKDNLQTQLTNNPFAVVHIATHGQFSSDPENTFILLWNQVLNVSELNSVLQGKRADRRIELLVLSACETAAGDKRAALGLAGVAVRGGTSSTLATLWQVSDESTAQLMGQFYRELKDNLPKAEALRQAQLKLWQNREQDWQVPSFWSPYILVGNWL